ncbi:MAG: hypothetical protein ACE5HE_03195 [Phycisphaerae bacterium]
MTRENSQDSRYSDDTRRVTPCADAAFTSRREVVRQGAKLAFVAPILSTFVAQQAYAAYSCYPQGHACTNGGGDAEICCPGLTCKDPDVDTNYTCEP